MKLFTLLFLFIFGCNQNKVNVADFERKLDVDTIRNLGDKLSLVKNVSGEWKYEKKSKDSKVPEELFTVVLQQSGNEIKGQYCAIAKSGGKVDCEVEETFNINGAIIKDKIIADFFSFFGSPKHLGVVEILIKNDSTLEWTIIKSPKSEFYAPKNAVLHKKNTVAVKEFLLEESPVSLELPFSFYQYFNNENPELNYPSYPLTPTFIEFLKSIGYDAESYQSFVFRDKNDLFYLVSISRGDSEYYVLVTTNGHEIVDYNEIGSIGNENAITFKIFPNFVTEKYLGNSQNGTAFETLRINKGGKIERVD